jgi:hypothetical protein
LDEGRRRRIQYLARNLDRLSPRELKTVAKAVNFLERVLHEWPAEK